MIRELALNKVGPAPEMRFQFAPRLNVLTGDNGLGKTLVLDVLWWVLTTTWVNGVPAYPMRPLSGGGPENGVSASPHKTSDTPEGVSGARISAIQDPAPEDPIAQSRRLNSGGRWIRERQSWEHEGWKVITRTRTKSHSRIQELTTHTYVPPTLLIYARIDGSFAVWDAHQVTDAEANWAGPAVVLGPAELFDGKRIPSPAGGRPRTVCRGLIEDWVSWQGTGAPEFQVLQRVLTQLSEDGEPLVPGRPTRVRLDDHVDIPTLAMPWGEVPVTLASAGTKRVLGLAYLLVWAWSEHLRAAHLTNRPPTSQMLVLIDEVELHLHPRWQAVMLPALLAAAEGLGDALAVQVVATTHAPMVLTSIEPLFQEELDNLFLLERDGQVIRANELPFSRAGDVSAWLNSEAFGEVGARSREATLAIGAAMDLMAERLAEAEAKTRALEERLLAHSPDEAQAHAGPLVERIHALLTRTLPSHDAFWRRWVRTWRGASPDPRGR